MRRALAALLCCALFLAAAHPDDNDSRGGAAEPAESAPADRRDAADYDSNADDDGDSAPFTLVVEHADGWRCSASLVSLRTAVTSAKCARGISPETTSSPAPLAASPADLWVHAPPAAAPHSSRRVARIAFAAESETAEGPALSEADVAVLELEAALGGGARAILMATNGAECGPPGACHVVRAQRRGHGARSRLRIVDEALVPTDACAVLLPRAAATRRHMLCLRGDVLCPSEWGAGVVCEGKLCGVLSGSAWEHEPGRAERCGALHAAAAAPRWRRFLHCAHTPRACARGGECAHLCSERLLLEDEPPPSESAAPPARAAPPAPAAPDYSDAASTEAPPAAPHRTPDVTGTPSRGTAQSASPRRAAPAPTRTAPRPPATPAPAISPPSVRPAAEFEPNRPDFKVTGAFARKNTVFNDLSNIESIL
ncbi:hypothetical protein O3G_MSEX001444 [Manduca sexta]|uniref:Peptidase S1 domain-containing protein n=1 Tax=Manduca sexta TaxID=7130 RepID=A0A922CCN5_MANSE|nr:hypothetical protein O3G_MSEX001444 [Manduca sexta]